MGASGPKLTKFAGCEEPLEQRSDADFVSFKLNLQEV